LHPIPDDEILGPGATLRKHVLAGDEVYCLILGEGAVMHGIDSEELVNQSRSAGKVIGFNEMRFIGLKDNELDTYPLLYIIKAIEAHLKTIQPNIIYTHHFGDLNIDHRITFQAVMTACRPGCSTVKEIYAFEISSSTDYANNTGLQPFIPDKFVDIKETLQCKINAMKCYQTELRDWPHPRSLEGIKILAQFRGMMVNKEYCEAFETIRKVG
jgi:LmbE family N-acetylglucosaminyl deacetylase